MAVDARAVEEQNSGTVSAGSHPHNQHQNESKRPYAIVAHLAPDSEHDQEQQESTGDGHARICSTPTPNSLKMADCASW